MRKNSVRKWLHAVLDLLPLFVIPIFAIYTRNENYNSNIEVQVYENKEVVFNQIAKFESPSGYSANGSEITANTSNDFYPRFDMTIFTNTHQYIIMPYAELGDFSLLGIFYLQSGQSTLITNMEQNNYYKFTYNDGNGYIFVRAKATNGDKLYVNLFDLTRMYGEGNEPSVNEFIQYFNDNMYPQTIAQKMIIPDYLETYNDTDVGSQFVYTLYNATDKYFNCTNLFNLEQVWNWVQLNLFGGNAPLMVYVVWQVIVYEFFMDLIFLLYSVFMFIIDFAQDCLEKPFNRIRRL